MTVPTYLDIWRCPLCHTHFSQDSNTWRCEQGHCFDQSKFGYINLLPVNKKNSIDPGDSKEMLQARRTFLEAGGYDPLLKKITETIQHLPSEAASTVVGLDCGSGEGYFTGHLAENLDNSLLLGVDIAKIGMQMAAKKYKQCSFAVASNFDLPIHDETCDFVIRNFAPGKNEEFSRVLNSEGKLIVIAPAENHLVNLRKRVYEKVSDFNEIDVGDGFELTNSDQVEFNFELNTPELVQSLFQMTPFFWKIKRDSSLNSEQSFSDTAHFQIATFQKN